ncbi:HAMP domain-containing sensor histidine kinase [Microbacterium sp. VKM Ac-2870]|uniref:sensor histidine kinase n=1 Tax=Microbacterium sp. VKM Ac-2870 TaxID=2783825 RepID=UPI002B26860A|nr:HAMP domain-containing sensor histidine kinase [Microbacterium sp. VKM Ac-2870]
MNRAARLVPTSRRARTLAVILAVVAAGFAFTGLALLVLHAVTGAETTWSAVGVFAAAGALTLAVTTVVGWFLIDDPASPGPPEGLDTPDALFDAQRRLLDDVRHELKTPITIVRGHLELMDPEDPVDVGATRALGIAELDRMTRLIGDIDLLAAAESDNFTMGDVDLAALTQRVSELVTVIGGHGWSLEQEASGIIHGDHDRLLQAWLQLADNAAKYTPSDSPIEIGSAVHPSGAQLWVRDHGAGIAPAVRHRIFRRFDRGTGKRSVGGSGLGLAIVDAIAKAHGGHCVVADTPGGGATFTIEIPIGTQATLPTPVRAGDVVQQREASG